jgi:hypothetical protein
MKSIILLISVLAVFLISVSTTRSDDLNTRKMEQITKEICEIMVKGDNSGEKLKKYISEEWLDRKNINLKKYKINNYSPETFEIVYSGADVCIVTIGGSSWSHLLVFKFTEERGKYYVIPMGISTASSDYIEPWWSARDYLCKTTENEEK